MENKKLKDLRDEFLNELNTCIENANENELNELSNFVCNFVGELPNSLIIFSNYFNRKHITDFSKVELTSEQLTDVMEQLDRYIDYDGASNTMRDCVNDCIEDNIFDEHLKLYKEENNNNE